MQKIKLFFLLFFSCPLFLKGQVPVPSWEDFFSQGEKFSRAQVGIYVEEIGSGKILYERHAEQFFVPASVMKIPITAAALAFLGEEYRFATLLEYEGELKEGLLKGNVWVRGGGDPTLMLEDVTGWKEKLRTAGIEKIQGKVVLDESYFEKAAASPYWNFEDLGNYYGAGASALAINHNQYTLFFQPGKEVGEKAQVVKMEPEVPGLVFHNEVITGASGSGDQVTIFGMEYSPHHYYRGSVPQQAELFSVKGSLPHPALLLQAHLETVVAPSEGVEIREKKEESTQTLYTHLSSPLKTILPQMNLWSMNLYAEHLLKLLGKGSAVQGRIKMEEFLRSLGIAAQIKDGAGLARTNLITPQGVVHLLVQAPEIENFLPVTSLGEATIKGKTGSMSNICNFAGYLIMPSGKKYAFAIFCNNYAGPLKEVREETQRFLEMLVQLFMNSAHSIP